MAKWTDFETNPIGTAKHVEELQAKLDKAEDFVLATIRYAGSGGDDFLADKARVTLAALKGQDND